ncbi:MAG: hypothetical protein ACREOO_01675 [bacterium]
MLKLGPILLSWQSPALWQISIPLLAFVVFLTLRRANRKRLWLRLAAGILSVFSLCALAAQPHRLISQGSLEGILITPGAEAPQAQTRLDSLSLTAKIFSLPGTDTSTFRGRAYQSIPDVGYLERHYPTIGKLHVFGHGLRNYDWMELDSIQITTYLSPPAFGIQAIHWQRTLSLGEKLHVQGSVAGVPNDGCRLLLFDPSGMLIDSLAMSEKDSGLFTFQASPPATGTFLYELLLVSKREGVRESVDVAVRPPGPLKILVLEATVRFDTKYFKNWASQHRHALAMRTLISRERYREELINLPGMNLRQITSALLRDFAVVIIDGRTLAMLHASERQALRAAIEQEGLGMLIIPDEAIFDERDFAERNFFAAFELKALAGLDQRVLQPLWPDLDTLRISAIPAEPFEIENVWGTKPLIRDDAGRWLAAAEVRGQGTIGLSLIRDSYRWVLEGKPEVHAAYWSYLLSELARQSSSQKDQWNVRHGTPVFVDQPLALTVQTSSADPIGLVTTGAGTIDSIFMAQDVVEPGRWHGTFWPRASGWHAIATQAGEASRFYVSVATQWQTWQQAQKNAATRQHAAYSTSVSHQRLAPFPASAEPIPRIWFFLTFLLGAGYLWVERKFMGI